MIAIRKMLFWLIMIIIPIGVYYIVGMLFCAGYGGDFIGAFFGALFAAMSAIFYETFLKYRDKEIHRYNDLILYELELNKCMNILSDVNFQINKILLNLDPVRHHLSAERLALSDVPIISLRNIDVKNRLFSIYQDLRKLNSDLENRVLIYNSNVQMVADNSALNRYGKVEYLNKLNDSFKESLKQIKIFGDETIRDIIECVARIRVLARQDQPSLWKHFYRLFIGWEHDEAKFHESVQQEISKVKSEIKSVQQESGEKIAKVRGAFSKEKN